MLVIGLLLVVLAALALIAALFAGADDPAVFDLGILEIQTNTLGAFLIGAATVLVFVMGLELIRSGVRRANRRRKERKELGRLSEKLEAHEAEQRRDRDDTTPTSHDAGRDTSHDTGHDTGRDTGRDTGHHTKHE